MSPTTARRVLSAKDLPDIMSPQDVADFEACDVRTVRKDLEAGKVPGAFKRGSRWKVAKFVYLSEIGGGDVRDS